MFSPKMLHTNEKEGSEFPIQNNPESAPESAQVVSQPNATLKNLKRLEKLPDSQKISNAIYKKRLQQFLKNVKAEPDVFGHHISMLYLIAGELSAADSDVDVLRKLFPTLLRPTRFISEQVREEFKKIEVLNLEHPVFIEINKIIGNLQELDKQIFKKPHLEQLKKHLESIIQCYLNFKEDLIHSDLENRIKLIEPKVQFTIDCLDMPYLIPASIGHTLASIDSYGSKMRKNEYGIHDVSAMDGLYFKVNGLSPLEVAEEHAMVAMINAVHIMPPTLIDDKVSEAELLELSEDKLENIFLPSAPTALLKLNEIPVKVILQPIKPKDPASKEQLEDYEERFSAYQLFKQKTHESNGNIDLVLNEKLNSEQLAKLNITTEYKEATLQVGYGLGQMCLRKMLSLHQMLMNFNIRVQQTAIEEILPALMENNLINIAFKNDPRKRADLLNAIQSNETLEGYWRNLLLSLPQEMRPLEYKNSKEYYPHPWLAIKARIKFTELQQIVALLSEHPELMIGQSLSDLVDYIDLAHKIRTLWPTKSIAEVTKIAADWLSKGDASQFSLRVISALLALSSDGKPDNFVVTFETDDEGNAISWSIQGIDNDNANAIPFIKNNYQDNNHILGIFCVLFCFNEMMNKPINEDVRQFILAKTPMEWVLDWLYVIYCQDFQYQTLRQKNILKQEDLYFVVDRMRGEREKILGISFELYEWQIKDIYEKWQKIYDICKNNPGATNQTLWVAAEPLVARLYTAVQKQPQNSHPLAAFNALYEKEMRQAPEITLRNEMKEALVPGNKLTVAQALAAHNITLLEKDDLVKQDIHVIINDFLQKVDLRDVPSDAAYRILDSISRFDSIKKLKLAINPKDTYTFLHSAIKQGNVALVKLLVNSGCNINLVNEIKQSLLHQFFLFYDLDCYTDESAKELASFLFKTPGLLAYEPDEVGISSLFYFINGIKCAPLRAQSILQEWIKNDFNLVVFDQEDGSSLLDKCIKRNEPLAFAMLVKYGALQLSNLPKSLEFITAHKDCDGKTWFRDYEASRKKRKLSNTDMSSELFKHLPTMKDAEKTLKANHPSYPFISAMEAIMPKVSEEAKLKDAGLEVRGAFSGRRVLSKEIANLIFDAQGNVRTKFESNDDPTLPKVTELTGGRHKVLLVIYQGHSLVIKINPDFPGIAGAMLALDHSLDAKCLAEGEFALLQTNSKNNQYLQVWLSRFIPGANFSKIINKRNAEHTEVNALTNEVGRELDKEHLSMFFVLALLAVFEDGQPGNFVLSDFYDEVKGWFKRLVGIDYDRAFVQAFKDKLLEKNTLYCLKEAREALHPKVVQKILKINPQTQLRMWLNEVVKQQNAKEALFNDKRWKNIKRNPMEPVETNVPMHKGVVARIFNNLLTLQEVLQVNPEISVLALLSKLDRGIVSTIYESSFDPEVVVPQSTKARVYFILGELYKIENDQQFKTITSKYDIWASNVLKKDEKEVYRIEKAREELEIVVLEKKALNDIAQECNKYDGKHSPVEKLILDSSREKVMAAIQWKNLPQSHQKKLLKSFFNTSFVTLRINGCEALTDELLLQLVALSPCLEILALKECPNVTPLGISNAIKSTKLQKLFILSYKGKNAKRLETPSTSLHPNAAWKLPPSVRRIVLDGCTDTDMIWLENQKIDLRLKNCNRLTEVRIVKCELTSLVITNCLNIGIVNLMQILNGNTKKLKNLKITNGPSLSRQLAAELILQNKLWTRENFSFLTNSSNYIDFSNNEIDNSIKEQMLSFKLEYSGVNVTRLTANKVGESPSFVCANKNFLNFLLHYPIVNPKISILEGETKKPASIILQLEGLEPLFMPGQALEVVQSVGFASCCGGMHYCNCDLKTKLSNFFGKSVNDKNDKQVNLRLRLPNGQYLITNPVNGIILVNSLLDNTPTRTLNTPHNNIIGLWLLRNGQIVSIDRNLLVCVWDLPYQTMDFKYLKKFQKDIMIQSSAHALIIQISDALKQVDAERLLASMVEIINFMQPNSDIKLDTKNRQLVYFFDDKEENKLKSKLTPNELQVLLQPVISTSKNERLPIAPSHINLAREVITEADINFYFANPELKDVEILCNKQLPIWGDHTAALEDQSVSNETHEIFTTPSKSSLGILFQNGILRIKDSSANNHEDIVLDLSGIWYPSYPIALTGLHNKVLMGKKNHLFALTFLNNKCENIDMLYEASQDILGIHCIKNDLVGLVLTNEICVVNLKKNECIHRIIKSGKHYLCHAVTSQEDGLITVASLNALSKDNKVLEISRFKPGQEQSLVVNYHGQAFSSIVYLDNRYIAIHAKNNLTHVLDIQTQQWILTIRDEQFAVFNHDIISVNRAGDVKKWYLTSSDNKTEFTSRTLYNVIPDHGVTPPQIKTLSLEKLRKISSQADLIVNHSELIIKLPEFLLPDEANTYAQSLVLLHAAVNGLHHEINNFDFTKERQIRVYGLSAEQIANLILILKNRVASEMGLYALTERIVNTSDFISVDSLLKDAVSDVFTPATSPEPPTSPQLRLITEERASNSPAISGSPEVFFRKQPTMVSRCASPTIGSPTVLAHDLSRSRLFGNKEPQAKDEGLPKIHSVAQPQRPNTPTRVEKGKDKVGLKVQAIDVDVDRKPEQQELPKDLQSGIK